MGKVVSKILVMLALLLTVSCEADKPWVGEWIPDSGNQDGVIELNSDGSAVYNQQSEDGSIYIEGKWTPVEGQENKFTLEYDASTLEVSADNPIVELVLSEAGKVLGSQTQTGTVSEDGETLHFNGGNGGYIRK